MGGQNWLVISWVFYRNDLFKKMTCMLIEQSPDLIESHGLPIPGTIIDKMNKDRIGYIEQVIDGLHNLLSKTVTGCFRDPTRPLHELCTTSVHGSLTIWMMKLNILSPKPQGPYRGLTISRLLSTCRDMQSPYIADQPGFGHAQCRLSCRVGLVMASIVQPLGFDLDIAEFKSVHPGN
ncbi:hypothetical protein BJX70DRAFT_136120 [Aspergillus crustosus]